MSKTVGQGNGATTVFSYNFLIPSASTAVVSVVDASGTVTPLNAAQYTLTGLGDPQGGTLTYPLAGTPLPTGAHITLQRVMPLQQLVQLTGQSNYRPDVVEDALDALEMQIQQVSASMVGALRYPDVDSAGLASILPAAAARALKVIGFDSLGNVVVVAPISGSATDLALQLASQHGSALVYFLQSLTGAVPITLEENDQQVVHAIQFGVRVTNTDAQNAAPLQAFWDACSSDTANAAPMGILPFGGVQTNVTPVCKKQFINLRGHGKNQSAIIYTGTTGHGITTAAIPYLKPCWSDFSVIATASAAGHAIDFSNVTNEVYDGELARLTLGSGGDCFYALRFFSMDVRNIRASSTNGHCFRTNNGPATIWTACYAVQCGPGKCGYRFIGETYMEACNGLDNGEVYAVFGSNPSATDGFQHDFPDGSGGWITDFPRVTMNGCNVEAFSVEGIRLHNSHRRFTFEGGKIDRSKNTLPANYTAVLTVCAQGVDINTPIRLNPSFYAPGGGTPFNGAGAQFWVQSGSVCIADMTGDTLGKVFDSTVSGGTLVPMVHMGVGQDVFGGRALTINAVQAGRASVGVLRFPPTTYTPVGGSQVIDVTGVTRALVSPAAAASISKATFATTTGADADFGRNGFLIIEAGNTNLTIKNNGALLADGFIMKTPADVTLTAGEIRWFMRSVTNSWWQEL